MKRINKYTKLMFLSIASFITFLLVWELATDVLHLIKPYSLPSPVSVVRSFIRKLYVTAPDGSTLPQHLLASLQVSLLGFAIGTTAGIPLGILMGWYQPVDRIVRPIFDFIRPIPPIGMIPIMVILFGIGLTAKAAVIFLSAFVPCVINAYAGIKETKNIHLWVARTCGASNLQMLRTVALPTALPLIFTGFRIAIGGAWTTLVVAEMLAATRGVGYMIYVNRTIGRSDLVLVGMLTIGAVGTILSFILECFERRFLRG